MTSLALVAKHPEALEDLSILELAALVMQASARIAVKASEAQTAALVPPLTLAEAAPLLGMQIDTLRRRAKSDPAYRALRFDNGTDRFLFDAAKIARFRERRTGL